MRVIPGGVCVGGISSVLDSDGADGGWVAGRVGVGVGVRYLPYFGLMG